ncbi:cysteine peptidase family C39 domain-containing protein [Phycisphaeraceae bacterium D3-23]
MSKTNSDRIDDTLAYVRTTVSNAAKDALQNAWANTNVATKRQILNVLSFGWRGFGKDKQAKTDRRHAACAWLLTMAMLGDVGSTVPKSVAYIKSRAKAVVGTSEPVLQNRLRAKLPPNPPPPRRAARNAPVVPASGKVRMPMVMGGAHPTRSRARNDIQQGDNGKDYYVYRQEKSHSCGPTCCLIVDMNATDGKGQNEEDMRQMTSTAVQGAAGYKPYNGTGSMMPLITTLRGCGHAKAAYYEKCTPANLQWAVQPKGTSKSPAIIRIQWRNGAGHFVVVADCHNNRFTVIDPLKGGIRALTAAELGTYDNGAGFWDGRIVALR